MSDTPPVRSLPRVAVQEKAVAGHALEKAVRVSGVAVFTGQRATVRLAPGQPGQGVWFDLAGERVRAVAENARDYPNCSGLGGEKGRVLLVEHVLSALYGLGVYDAEVTVVGGETPLLDGSAQPFVSRLLPVLRPVRVKRAVVGLVAPFVLGEASGQGLSASPASRFGAQYQLDYDDPPFSQTARYRQSPAAYAEQVAPARTFIGENKARALMAAGFLRGGSRRNAAVLTRRNLPGFRWRVPQEAARHKILDLIGDLALLGAPLLADIDARRTGHAENRALAALLREAAMAQGLT